MIHLPVIHRQRQGISQTDMAQRLGVSRRWLIEFEHARSPPNSMNGDTMSENTLNA